MRAIHPDPRRTLLAGLGALALTLAALALPSQLGDASLTLSSLERSATPAPIVVEADRSQSLSDPLDSPLMQWLRAAPATGR